MGAVHHLRGRRARRCSQAVRDDAPRVVRRSLAAGLALAVAQLAIPVGGKAADGIRERLLAIPVTVDLGGETTVSATDELAFGQLAANAPLEREFGFLFGNRLFNTEWMVYPGPEPAFDGLGPLFNRTSCSGCHVRDGRGRPPANPGDPMDSMLVRLSLPDGSPHPAYGNQLQERAIPGVPPEGRAIVEYEEIAGAYGDGTPYTLLKPTVRFTDLGYGPLGEVLVSARVAPHLIGLGLLEAVPVSTLEALADPDDADGDGISGRINWLEGVAGNRVPGRFGWKANVVSVAGQTASAAIADMGLTTSLFPEQDCTPVQVDCSSARARSEPELSDSFLDRLVTYMQVLAVPRARPHDAAAFQTGLDTFTAMGCASCHVPTLQTDDRAPLPELRNQTFHPFTDLLLHDMGEGLADGRPDGSAMGSEWRTPPLWGLGLVPMVNGHDRLLHDGRARGFAEAILWHGGEAEAAKEAFRTAPEAERAALIAFLRSL